jgi:hypothetical protein
MRAYTHRRPSATARSGPPVEDFRETEAGFGFAANGNGTASGAVDSKSVIAGRCGKHMFKRSDTSAERLDVRLDPWESNRGNRTMRRVTRIRRSLKAAAPMAVHDAHGPIVTGVLGRD